MVPVRDELGAASTARNPSGQADHRAARRHSGQQAAKDLEVPHANENLHQMAGAWIEQRETAVLEATEEGDHDDEVGERFLRKHRLKFSIFH